jgi:hypothetical protein
LCGCNSSEISDIISSAFQSFSEFNNDLANVIVTHNDDGTVTAGFDMNGLAGVASDMINSDRAGVTLTGPGADYDQQAITNSDHMLIGARRWGHNFLMNQEPWMTNLLLWSEAYETTNGFVNGLPSAWAYAQGDAMWDGYIDRVGSLAIRKCGGSVKHSSKSTFSYYTGLINNPFLE